jgi:hypothetical protein
VIQYGEDGSGGIQGIINGLEQRVTNIGDGEVYVSKP